MSLRLIREDGFENADIIYITDSNCKMPKDFLSELRKERAERRFTITGVLLDSSSPGMEFGLTDFCQNIYQTVYGCFQRVLKKLGHATAAFTLDIYGHVLDEMKQARPAWKS